MEVKTKRYREWKKLTRKYFYDNNSKHVSPNTVEISNSPLKVNCCTCIFMSALETGKLIRWRKQKGKVDILLLKGHCKNSVNHYTSLHGLSMVFLFPSSSLLCLSLLSCKTSECVGDNKT